MTDVPSAELLARYRRHDPAAAEELFRRYAERLTSLARSRLSRKLAVRVDAEDVIQSAYRSFFLLARDGEIVLRQSGDLWRLLVRITLRKVSRTVRRHGADCRSVDREQPLLEDTDADHEAIALSREPTPADAVALIDEMRSLLAPMSALQRRIVELRLQGHEVEEVAAAVERSPRTIRRTLAALGEELERRLKDTEKSDPPPRSGSLARRASKGSLARRKQGFVSPPRKQGVVSPTRKQGIGFVSPTRKQGIGFVSPTRKQGIGTKRPLPQPPPRSGEGEPELLIPYSDIVLRQQLGEGGMGKVYRALWRSRGTQVAVKLLKKPLRQHERAIALFLEEAALLGRFRHPGIVAVHGLGLLPDGGNFLVMDLVEGTDLARQRKAGPIGVAQALLWVSEAADAIDHAHQRGVIHCDLKPSNLLLDLDGRIRVTDFGLARSLAGDDRRSAGGTAGFMAPEQFDSSWGAISARTDVYGLGAVLHTLLAGTPPLPADGLLEAQALTALPADVPESISRLCRRCLARAPEERFASAAELAAALREHE